MQSWSPDDPSSPHPAPSNPGCDTPEEVDIDLKEPTDPPEHVGDYDTIEDYFRGLLEEFIHPDANWLLACLDMAKVRERFEGGQYAYRCIDGRVYRRRVAPKSFKS